MKFTGHVTLQNMEIQYSIFLKKIIKSILENSWAATSLSVFHPGQPGQRSRLPRLRIAFFGVIRSALSPWSSSPPSERTRLKSRSDYVRGEVGWKQLFSLMRGLWEKDSKRQKNDHQCVLYSCIPHLKGPTQTSTALFQETVKVTPTLKTPW